MVKVVGASDMSVMGKRVQKSFLKGEKSFIGTEATNLLRKVVFEEEARQDNRAARRAGRAGGGASRAAGGFASANSWGQTPRLRKQSA